MSAHTNAELAGVIRKTAAMVKSNDKQKKLLLMAADRLERSGHAMNEKRAILYTVWDNRTDECLALDLSGKKCAEILGITYNSFMIAIAKGRKKWTIEKRYADEEVEED